MYLKTVSLTLVLGFLSLLTIAQPCLEVVGYYPNWQWYDRNKLVRPATIDYSKYTVINYAFFAPQPNGTIQNTDTWADDNLLYGEPDWVNGGYLPNTSIVDLAHNAGVKVLPSIGGWTLSDNFPSIAADPAKRALFAHECNRLIDQYNFDGVDIDWEYPGYAPHNGGPADKVNFTLLMQQIRDSLDAHTLQTGNTYLITAALGAAQSHMAEVEWSNISNILDMINLMSYDFYGSWDPWSNHNSPLYDPAIGNPGFSIDGAFTTLTTTHGVPASKINIGLAFYGRSLTGCSQLHCTGHSGQVDQVTFPEDLGMPMYYNIESRLNLFTRHWDATAAVSYLIGNDMATFVSYDDEESIGLKAQYIVDNGARGGIIWEITGDYIETSAGSGVVASTPLADTLNAVFCGSVSSCSAPDSNTT